MGLVVKEEGAGVNQRQRGGTGDPWVGQGKRNLSYEDKADVVAASDTDSLLRKIPCLVRCSAVILK